MDEPRARGGCLCGAVRYEIHGPLRDVLLCHCLECRRSTGHVFAGTSTQREHLVLVEQRGLRWVDSPQSDAHARRGFCGECGSNLFWDPPGRPNLAITAGTLDEPTGLRVMGHWYVDEQGDYYEIPDDGTPRHDRPHA